MVKTIRAKHIKLFLCAFISFYILCYEYVIKNINLLLKPIPKDKYEQLWLPSNISLVESNKLHDEDDKENTEKPLQADGLVETTDPQIEEQIKAVFLKEHEIPEKDM